VDLINELGELAFASRLKRLSERLLKDVTRIYKELEVDFEARWFPILYSLTLKTKMSITELAGNLSLTHPAVNQLAAEMEKAGLINSAKDRRDERRRLLQLTANGKKTAKILKPVWDDIAISTREVLKETGKDILNGIEAVEQNLDKKEMYDRVRGKIIRREMANLTVERYRPAYKKYFRAFNYRWLREYFKVEPSDERLLSNPKREILDKGGEVFFALFGKQVVGTAALIKHENGVLELAKMAVEPEFRGFGIGKRLLERVMGEAKRRKAERLWLATSPKLVAAVGLYEKYGFRTTSENPFGGEGYERCTVVMVCELKDQP